jgi:hypothetical protein
MLPCYPTTDVPHKPDHGGPGEPEATSVSIQATELIMLLDGVDRRSVERHPRHVRESA